VTPSGRALLVLGLWVVLGIAAAFESELTVTWALAGGGLALVAALDALDALRQPAPRVVRRVPPAVPVGVGSRVVLSVENASSRVLRLELADHHPTQASTEGLPITLQIAPGERAESEYQLWPTARGDHRFGRCEVRIASALGLWRVHRRCGAPLDIRSYPNFRAAVGYELLAADNRLGALGIRRRRRRGEGLEFHQLREYRAGDTLRQIDWKATARMQRTISREYQDERDQQIVFLLDCGRRLHTRDGERSHFDAALDAILLAAHVALRQGDAVGLMTFSGERRWLAPRKGVAQANALLDSVYDLTSGARAADYTAAARDLMASVRKRALVIVVSNVRDEDTDELRSSLRLLSRRHLVLLASLREAALGEALAQPIGDLDAALRVASIRLYLEQRSAALRTLERSGALLLDSEPDALPVALVNRYFDIKAAGIL
jgi:uncharacterized protein (DUF58 family)